MSFDLPPLPALQAFEAAARHENFATAAQELNLSQSAVSHRVRALERHLGYPLFERLPRGLRLTESAKAYLPPLRKAFEEILGATSGVFGARGGNVLTIRGPSSYMAIGLPTIIDQFAGRYPHIDIKLTSSIWADRLAMDETDIDLRYGFGRWPGFESHLLFRDSVVAVSAPHIAKDIAGESISNVIKQRSLVHILGPEDYWAMLSSQLGLVPTRKRRDIQVDSALTAAEVAASSDRIALLPQHLTAPFVTAGRLTCVLDIALDVEQGLYMLLADTMERRRPEIVLFRDWLLESYQ